MRKRSKIRVPQDSKPWLRVIQRNEEDLHLFGKKTSHWRSGNRRNLQTALYNAQQDIDKSKLLLKSLFMDQRISEKSLYRAQLQYKLAQLNKKSVQSKPKNYCLFLGKGRTYNRQVLMSRQKFRELVRYGLLPGFNK